MTATLGIVEGFYGASWDERARHNTIAFLAQHDYRFYYYAPKADDFLRRRWRESHPADAADALARLSAKCRDNGVSFGIGLSPYEIYRAFDAPAQNALARKLSELNALGLNRLAILFDDMRGDIPDLAQLQARIVHFAAERTHASQIAVCPTYYSDDPLLDRFFGNRSDDYLEELGKLLDPAIDIFWTGPEVCTREFSVGHLERVGGQLGRRPLLWDNYPVNDGKRMSQFLHLRAFTGRPAQIGAHIAGHAINPALQPTLSCIPALSLAESYARGDAYDYGAAFRRAAIAVCGDELANMLRDDLGRLHDIGLDNLGDSAAKLRARYAPISHPAAREIVAWLEGAYRFSGKIA